MVTAPRTLTMRTVALGRDLVCLLDYFIGWSSVFGFGLQRRANLDSNSSAPVTKRDAILILIYMAVY